MPSAELLQPGYTKLISECDSFLTEKNKDLDAAQKLLNRVQSLRTILKPLQADEAFVSDWIAKLENNILK